MSQIRSDLWCAAFIRRHNDLGRFCVVARKGHPIAGQIWIEIDHLDKTVSLFAPAPAMSRPEDSADRIFEKRCDKVEAATVRARLDSELNFDPDIWVISLEMRESDPGIEMATA